MDLWTLDLDIILCVIYVSISSDLHIAPATIIWKLMRVNCLIRPVNLLPTADGSHCKIVVHFCGNGIHLPADTKRTHLNHVKSRHQETIICNKDCK